MKYYLFSKVSFAKLFNFNFPNHDFPYNLVFFETLIKYIPSVF